MTNPLPQLTKRDVETLLRDYDADPVAALTVALRVIAQLPHARWTELLDAIGLTQGRRIALAAGDATALDDLATELNERRRLGP